MPDIDASAYGTLGNILAGFRHHGYARPNRFEIILYPPRSGTQYTSSELREICLHCETVSLPGRNLNSLEDANTYGPMREIVDTVAFEREVSFSFHASTDLREREFFESWQELAFNKRNWNAGWYDDYVGEADIWLLDTDEKKQYGLKLREVFPKTISPIELNAGELNTVAKVSVSLQFRFWEKLTLYEQSGYAAI